MSTLIGSAPGYVGLRGGRPADRKGAPSPLFGGAVRRDRKGPSGRVQHAAADPGGRPSDRRLRAARWTSATPSSSSPATSAPAASRAPRWALARTARRKEAEFEKAKEHMLSELRRTFRPEFLNRIDEIIVFEPLNAEDTRKIADSMMNNLEKRLEERGIHLDHDRAKPWTSSPRRASIPSTARVRCAVRYSA